MTASEDTGLALRAPPATSKAPARSLRGEVLPFPLMDATQEAPSSLRPRRPGRAARAHREAIHDIRSRRRLIGYLVRADLKKKGADTLLGNLWWIIDPLLQMIVYVVLVAFIFQQAVPDYPLFIFCAILPWKWFTSSRRTTRSRRSSGQERLIKQIHFPKIILPVASTTAGDRELRVRADPAVRAAARSSIRDRLSLGRRPHPGHRRRPVRVHAGVLRR